MDKTRERVNKKKNQIKKDLHSLQHLFTVAVDSLGRLGEDIDELTAMRNGDKKGDKES